MDTAPTEPLNPDPEPGPRRLTRSKDDRVIAGVCAGVGRYLGVDSTVVRIVTVALALFGGAGALLYLGALLLMPVEPGEGDAAPPDRGRALTIAGVAVLLLVAWPLLLGGGLALAGVLVPIALLALAGLLVWWLVSGEGPTGNAGQVARRAALGLGVLLLCMLVFLGGAWAAGIGGGAMAAGLVIAAGVVLLVGAFAGGMRWLILPALTLALGVGFVYAAGIDLDGGVGDREYSPARAADLPDRYELGIGQLVVDLRNTDLPPGDTPLELDLGVGSARVIVPEDVCVATDAVVGMGGVDVFDRENAGIDLDWNDFPTAPSERSRLVVDADLGVGGFEVHHDARSRFDERDHRFGDRDWRDDPADGERNTGCETSTADRGSDAGP